eukprot:TRINITY_DN44193_c0_g1_i1.p1 TRINITY_DN44193_c0_g1~~TRINITY_DN44193_c0_g1_i1.p1  ORF type:complete len:476 (-),score=67.56 TRINITY_DN44193_c0_g1_i1:534-1961(-)
MGQPLCCGKWQSNAVDTVSYNHISHGREPLSSSPCGGNGVVVWVDSVVELISAFALDESVPRGDLEHLFVPSNDSKTSSADDDIGAEMYFPRDVGVCSGSPWGMNVLGLKIPWMEDDTAADTNGYVCAHVEDVPKTWGFYVVADACGAASHLVARQVVEELPRLLLRNPRLYKNSCCALYESFLLSSGIASSLGCDENDKSGSRSDLSVALLRDGYLHVAWDGNSKVVLGRLAAKLHQPGRSEVSREKTKRPMDSTNVLMPIDRRRLVGTSPRRSGQESYSDSRMMKQWLKFDGPPPILRAVDLTASQNLPSQVGDPGLAAHPTLLGGANCEDTDGVATLPGPEVRRMRLKSDDVCVVIGSTVLWNWLSPEEVVTIVGQNMHRMAGDAADAIINEVRIRMGDPSEDRGNSCGDITVVVIFLAGSCYVKDFDMGRARHLSGRRYVSNGLTEAHDGSRFVGCLCAGKSEGGLRQHEC